jgi:hypothetical protein
MSNSDGSAAPGNSQGGAIFKVEPAIFEGCDYNDCRAGLHIYSRFRLTQDGWRWAAISLCVYTSAEDCKRRHPWGILGPHASWEDGRPAVEPDPYEGQGERQANADGVAELDDNALQDGYEALAKHWGAGSPTN